MRRTCAMNYDEILCLKNDIDWIKKSILGVFATIIINIGVTLITK